MLSSAVIAVAFSGWPPLHHLHTNKAATTIMQTQPRAIQPWVTVARTFVSHRSSDSTNSPLAQGARRSHMRQPAFASPSSLSLATHLYRTSISTRPLAASLSFLNRVSRTFGAGTVSASVGGRNSMVVSSVTVRSAVVDTIVGVGTTMRWVDTSSMDAKSAWTPVVNFLLLRQPYTQHRDVPGKLCVQGKCREGNNVHNVWLAHFEAESVQRFDVIPRWSADGTRHAPCEMPILAGADQMLPNHIYHFLRDFDVNRYLGVPRKVRAVHIDFSLRHTELRRGTLGG